MRRINQATTFDDTSASGMTPRGIGAIALGVAVAIGIASSLAHAQSATTTAPGAGTAPATTMPSPMAPATPMTGVMRPGITTPPAAMTAPPTTGAAAASGNGNQAVATTRANATAPAKGHNSFTMAQARKRLESNGFTNVSGLSKDRDGIWRGKASKAGSNADVWLDYKGNAGQS